MLFVNCELSDVLSWDQYPYACVAIGKSSCVLCSQVSVPVRGKDNVTQRSSFITVTLEVERRAIAVGKNRTRKIRINERRSHPLQENPLSKDQPLRPVLTQT